MIPVTEVMTRDVVTVGPNTPVPEVAKLLSSRRLTGVPVLTNDGFVIGIVSETDVFTKRGATVADIMTGHVLSITESTTIDEAARLLVGERVRRLPVLREGRLVGLISRSDVLDFFAQRVWTCERCAHGEHGLEPPAACRACGGTEFRLDRANPRT
ncbi:MAG: CBS domain-containing protein [Candidatus Dormibacteraeota bacterium]|nr:CBS domain-containing protein [Candidatus Dormibacteraeota bacterium]